MCVRALSYTIYTQWLQDREDFADLQSEQDACGPVFIRQALLTPGHKRGPHEVAVLAQWLQSKCHFSHLRPTQLETVVRSLTHAAIGPNQTLQPERRAVYFVLSGKAIMTKPGMPRAVVRCSWWSSIASGSGGGAQHSLQRDTHTYHQASEGQSLGARFWWTRIAKHIADTDIKLGRRMNEVLHHRERSWVHRVTLTPNSSGAGRG